MYLIMGKSREFIPGLLGDKVVADNLRICGRPRAGILLEVVGF